MIKNNNSFLRKAKNKTKALALGAVLLTAAVQAQNDLSVRFYNYGGPGGLLNLDVTVLDQVFGAVTINGAVRTADYSGTIAANGIQTLPTTATAFAGIQLVVVNGVGASSTYPTISQAQADALIAYVKQGGILVGSMENVRVTTTPTNTDFNEYVGERLLLQPSVNISGATTAGSGMGLPSNGKIGMYHNNGGPLNLNNGAGATADTSNTASTFVGVPPESIIYSTTSPASNADCASIRTLDFVAPSYPGDVAALAGGIKGFAYLSGEHHGPLVGLYRNNEQPNINVAELIYDFLYDPTAMATRRAWSQTPANVNPNCPVTLAEECAAGTTAPPLN